MNKTQRKFLEEELKKYGEYQKRLEILQEIIEQDKFLIKPLENHFYMLSFLSRSVEEALEELGELYKAFFQLYFLKGRNIERISIELRLTQYTVEKIKQEIIEKIAEKLGLI